MLKIMKYQVARGLAGLAMSVLLLVGVSACDAVGVTSGSSPAGSTSALGIGASGGTGGGSSSGGSTSSVAGPTSAAVLQISGTGTTEEVVVLDHKLIQFPPGPVTANTRYFQTFTANFSSAHPAGFTIRVLGSPCPLIRFNPHGSAYAPVLTHFSIIG